MDKNKRKEKIKICITVALILIIIFIALMINFKYSVEGEKNMPFQISKVIGVSTATVKENEGTTEKWNMNVIQNNDIYFSIEKVGDGEEKIQKIIFENITITKEPKIGYIATYMPTSEETALFTYAEDTKVQDSKLEYKGGKKSNTKTLEIGNQGGNVVLSFCNMNVGNFISNDVQEISYDGKMLTTMGINLEDLEFEVTFDFIIQTTKNSYKTNISLNLPCGDMSQEGKASFEITDSTQYIFKRM